MKASAVATARRLEQFDGNARGDGADDVAADRPQEVVVPERNTLRPVESPKAAATASELTRK